MADVTKSVDQLCDQLSITNVTVPRIDNFKDVYDFIVEYEMATATLSDDQRLKVLVKAFPPGRYQAWLKNAKEKLENSGRMLTWPRMKGEIITRYAETESRDRHFNRLRELRYIDTEPNKLFDFVEEVLYSFNKAYPDVKDDDSKVRFLKSLIPPDLKTTLSLIPEYDQPESLERFLKGIRKFDTMRSGRNNNDAKSESVKPSELAALFKSLLKEMKETKEVVAALRPRSPSPYRARPQQAYPSQSREASPQTNINESQQRSTQHEQRPRRSAAQNDLQSPPDRGNEQRNNQGRFRSNYRTNFQNRSGAREYQRNQQYRRDSYTQANLPKSDTSAENIHKNEHPAVISPGQAFNEQAYYKKFKVPPTPCAHCGLMHWTRHCPDRLN